MKKNEAKQSITGNIPPNGVNFPDLICTFVFLDEDLLAFLDIALYSQNSLLIIYQTMNITKTLLSIMLCCYCTIMAFGQGMTQEIEKVIKGKQVSVGVAVIYNDSIFTIANDDEYPIMSAFKFHITVAALKKMETENIPLDRKVYIEQKEMLKNTYSPLRSKCPDQRIHISYRDIIKYTVSMSDNNTCDWLIRFVGGIGKVDSYIKSLGIKEVNFTETEESMHADIMLCYNNWSTPLALAQLLKKVYTENILTKEHFAFLETTMIDCVSGKNKLMAGLPHDVKFGHKTGHSDRTTEGVQISEVDAGVVYLSNEEKYYIAVLIKDSRESDDKNAKIMADISNIVYRHLTRMK